MLTFKKIIICFILIVNTLFSIEFVKNGVEIFSINGDAKIGAMGGNNPAVIGINGKIFNNPALGNLKTNNLISFTYRDHFSGLAKDHLFSVAIKQNFFNSLSLGIIYREIENIPNTLDAFSLNGNQVVPIDYDLITFFDHWELASVLSISSQFSKYKIGFNIKSLMYSILNEKAFGIGFDMGIIHNINESFLLGIVLKNFPTMYINWTTGNNEIILPQLDIGLNYANNNLNVASGIQINSFSRTYKDDIIFNSGITQKISKDADIIIGYNSNSSFSMGIEIKNKLLIINYCYISGSKKMPFQSSQEMTFSIDVEHLNRLSDYISH